MSRGHILVFFNRRGGGQGGGGTGIEGREVGEEGAGRGGGKRG